MHPSFLLPLAAGERRCLQSACMPRNALAVLVVHLPLRRLPQATQRHLRRRRSQQLAARATTADLAPIRGGTCLWRQHHLESARAPAWTRREPPSRLRLQLAVRAATGCRCAASRTMAAAQGHAGSRHRLSLGLSHFWSPLMCMCEARTCRCMHTFSTPFTVIIARLMYVRYSRNTRSCQPKCGKC